MYDVPELPMDIKRANFRQAIRYVSPSSLLKGKGSGVSDQIEGPIVSASFPSSDVRQVSLREPSPGTMYH